MLLAYFSDLSLVVIAVALLLIAFVLTKTLLLLRKQMHISIRNHTYQMLKNDRSIKQDISQVLRDIVPFYDKHFLDFDESIQSRLVSALNYCESLSIGIGRGIYDEDTVRDEYKSIFMQLYGVMKLYIYDYRYETNSVESYYGFLVYLEKWSTSISRKRSYHA